MATAKTPAEAWVDAALPVLAAGGPDAVRVEQLANGLGVTKGGFYWHFPDRAAFLQRVLDRWEQLAVENVIEQLESHPGAARDKLRELFDIAFAFAVADEGQRAELAIRDWARRDPAVEARLRGVDERRMAYLRDLFAQICDDPLDTEARALTAYSLFVGQHFLATGHDGHTRHEVLRAALEGLLR
ncbi:AcrR family transcriptional regulator [Nocardioides thalensis]|uniref:AcrR family transcriptional regulator n=1 Tax=Nocardioides thalensis TaxID=1914755 RepID=A0A853C7H7_9ACTN|nr:TetR/AcrR family transcriptional regulator [Nocardioides thalensis]NYJ03514.1 AcrR family transcriptional regulator [Nocardioides thalensis]